ncbi:transposase family protein [Ruminococcaceae bacterium OttesenSCG-928-O06]|nr:transposase family protein [Ruminococcaceae bacterium OttesenSCG-928-O06]
MKKQMPDLRLDEFVVIDFLEDDLDMEIFVEPAISTSAITCIHCGSPPTTENGSEERFFRDLNIYEKRVGVEVQSHRYKCKSCNRTFSLQYRCIGRKEKMTKRLKNTT